MNRVRILFLSANPINAGDLSIEKEVTAIHGRLSRSANQIEIRSVLAATVVDLRRALLDFKPMIVHFSGHSSKERGLVFLDRDDKRKFIPTSALAEIFNLFSKDVKCVLLNACYSEHQAIEISRHVECVIGMESAISNKASIEFSAAFYDAFSAGRSFDFAYALGRNALQLAGHNEVLPIFLRRDQTASPGLVVHSNLGSPPTRRGFQVFLCHAKGDIAVALDLAARLSTDGYRVWCSEKDLLPGQNKRLAVTNALRESQAVIVCLSKEAISKAGFVQREIRMALEAVEEQPIESIFIIPVKVEDCDTPGYLHHLKSVKIFSKSGYATLKTALESRKDSFLQMI